MAPQLLSLATDDQKNKKWLFDIFKSVSEAQPNSYIGASTTIQYLRVRVDHNRNNTISKDFTAPLNVTKTTTATTTCCRTSFVTTTSRSIERRCYPTTTISCRTSFAATTGAAANRATRRWDKGGRGRGKGEPIDTEYSSDSESGLDTDDSIRKKRCALPKNKKKKRSKSKKAPKKKGKKYNVEIEVINLDNDKEEYPVFDDMIADGIREWEVIKIHPIKGTSYVYNNIYNIGIDWSQVNSVCFYMRLCVHRQPLTYFIPYLLLLDR